MSHNGMIVGSADNCQIDCPLCRGRESWNCNFCGGRGLVRYHVTASGARVSNDSGFDRIQRSFEWTMRKPDFPKGRPVYVQEAR
jgi:hypothetical protein